ncbi:MAG: hypothetical protein AUH85_10220 [Chloroflexi bacterium 13_1_40CM_4_68_4]|nr:MAG: hypothetical protein AUH85_10220 [Chloroflexi bacterium 13_1_40CM_4_68_4]
MNEKKSIRQRAGFSFVRLGASLVGITVGYFFADAIDPLAPSGGWGVVGVTIFAAFAVAGAIVGSLLDRRVRSS